MNTTLTKAQVELILKALNVCKVRDERDNKKLFAGSNKVYTKRIADVEELRELIMEGGDVVVSQ